MESLKTLKDIDGIKLGLSEHTHFSGEYCLSKKDLKQEAIKWIKERNKICKHCKIAEYWEGSTSNKKTINDFCDEHKFWIERFNITDEELK